MAHLFIHEQRKLFRIFGNAQGCGDIDSFFLSLPIGGFCQPAVANGQLFAATFLMVGPKPIVTTVNQNFNKQNGFSTALP